MAFQVANIISGNLIEVTGWQWGEQRGTLVKIADYSIQNEEYNEYAKDKLKTLLNNQSVDLKNPISIEKEDNDTNILLCSVYLNGINVKHYFPELLNDNATKTS